MFMAMKDAPASLPAPTAWEARHHDAAMRAHKMSERGKHTRHRKSMSGLSAANTPGYAYPAGYNQYTYGYGNSPGYGLPPASCPAGYAKRVINYFPLLTSCVPNTPPLASYFPSSLYSYGQGYSPYAPYGYPYSTPPYGSGLPTGQDFYIYYRTPQQCVAQGGLWDSFSQSCSSPSGSPPSVSGAPNTSQPPRVEGMQMYQAAAILNGAGYETWLVQQGSSYFNPPPGYNPQRVDIWVDDYGTVQRQGIG